MKDFDWASVPNQAYVVWMTRLPSSSLQVGRDPRKSCSIQNLTDLLQDTNLCPDAVIGGRVAREKRSGRSYGTFSLCWRFRHNPCSGDWTAPSMRSIDGRRRRSIGNGTFTLV